MSTRDFEPSGSVNRAGKVESPDRVVGLRRLLLFRATADAFGSSGLGRP